MKLSLLAIFTAGFIAGSVLLGGSVVADAKIVTLNLAVAGVLPISEGSLFCVAAASVLRPSQGDRVHPLSRPLTAYPTASPCGAPLDLAALVRRVGMKEIENHATHGHC